MKMSFDAHLRRDLIKLACMIAIILGVGALFFVSPALSTPTLLSIVFTMLASPLVAALERRGYPRLLSILILFATIGVASVAVSLSALKRGQLEWSAMQEKAPAYFDATIDRVKKYENKIKSQYPFVESVHPTESLVAWGKETGRWFVTNGPKLMGDLLTWILLVPILTFVLLSDGRLIRKRFFELVPNRFFEVTFMMTNEILTALSDYLRAKLVEALLVGLMTGVGLWLVGAPYAIVLGIVAGVTNIIPYAGPILGAVPGMLVVMLDPSLQNLVWPVALVYVIANVIDMLVIFPVIVAKLVDLHPLILIAVVIVGQQYYGLIGMLISIPIATALKVVFTEIYSAVYHQKSRRRVEVASPYDIPLIRME